MPSGDPLAVQVARWHERQSFERPTIWHEVGTDADPAAMLAAGIPAAHVAEVFGLDNPAAIGRTSERIGY